jgi:CheY-like chemotaxis protein
MLLNNLQERDGVIQCEELEFGLDQRGSPAGSDWKGECDMKSNSRVSILIVEDDIQTLELYHTIIQRIFPNYTVDIAPTPEDAVSLFQAKKYDIVVSDVNMGKSDDGIMLANALNKINPNVFIFLVTAYNKDFICINGESNSLCVKDIFTKPLDVKMLADKITEAAMSISTFKHGNSIAA